MEGQAGDVLGGRYRLIEVIGSGGMGRVWEAHDQKLNRPVAVKEVAMPTMPAAEREDRLLRAEREGRNAAVLADHPSIVTVYDVVIERGVPWIVMQLVTGRALHKVLADGPLSVDATARLAEAMLTALASAHDSGVIHRDVKPANIMMTEDGRALLTDFGIARAEGDQTVTVTGAFVGSLAYIAPERAEGKADSPAADLFSLGVTLYEAVEGASPFQRESTTGTLTAILLKPLPPMRRAGRLAPLISALTSKNPAERPDSAEALRILRGEEWNEHGTVWQEPTRLAASSASTASAADDDDADLEWQARRAAKRKREERWTLIIGACVASVLLAVWLINKNSEASTTDKAKSVCTEAFSDIQALQQEYPNFSDASMESDSAMSAAAVALGNQLKALSSSLPDSPVSVADVEITLGNLSEVYQAGDAGGDSVLTDYYESFIGACGGFDVTPS